MDPTGPRGSVGLERGTVIGAYTGMAAGMALGVHVIAKYGDQTSSLGWTMAGALIPAAIGGGIMIVAAYQVNDPMLALGVGVGFAGPVIGALVASNLTRRWDAPSPLRRVTATMTPTHDSTLFNIAGLF